MPIRTLSVPAIDDLPMDARGFLRWLGGPGWIVVPGRDRSRRRLVVALLHGNEPSGLNAAHAWLRLAREPVVDTVFYIGSVAAALQPPLLSHRSLPGERDANRVYGAPADDAQGRIAAAFKALFVEHEYEAVIDLHNNSGRNPAYGIGYGVDGRRLNLTGLFSDWYMDMDLRLQTLVEFTSERCPSVSIECGRAGDPGADAVALAGLERFLQIDDLRLDAPPPAHLQVLHRPVRVHLRPDISVAFAGRAVAGVELTLRDDLDRHNFEQLDAGVPLGWLRDPQGWPLLAHSADGEEVSRQLLSNENGELVTRRPMIPAMLTTDPRIAVSDCLFYAMERRDPP